MEKSIVIIYYTEMLFNVVQTNQKNVRKPNQNRRLSPSKFLNRCDYSWLHLKINSTIGI